MRVAIGFILLIMTFIFQPSAVGQSLPTLGYCDGCSVTMQWRLAAESASFQRHPAYIGTHYVYVVDRVGETVQAFSVRRWFEDTGVIPNAANESTRRSSQGGYYHADAVSMAADPYVQQAILDGLAAANEIKGFLDFGLVPIEELGLFAEIPSAIDLVGPDESTAGMNRAALRNELERYVNQSINSAALQLYDLAQMALTQLLSDSSVTWFGGFVITFPDGTTIRVNLNGLRHVPGAGLFSWAIEVEILQHTVMGGGLSAVPLFPGHFSNFMYEGDINIVAALYRLAQRYDEAWTSIQ